MAGTLGAGYLPILGPSPLRFQPARSKALPLPPLDMGNTEALAGSNSLPDLSQVPAVAKLTAPSNSPAANPPRAPFTSESPDAFDDAAQITIAVSPQALSEPAAPNPLVTPQMLVQFFKPGGQTTNGGGISIVVPVDPAPPRQGNSTNQ